MSFSARRQKIDPLKIKQDLTLPEAKKKLMDLVARRDHSEKELRQKLAAKTNAETVHETIEWARSQNWLASPEKLTNQFSEYLSRRGKGVRRINQKLKELGLHTITANPELELQKAQTLVRNKWSAEDFRGLDYAEKQKLKAKIMRYLATRGYESNIISEILKTEFKNTPLKTEDDIYDEEF